MLPSTRGLLSSCLLVTAALTHSLALADAGLWPLDRVDEVDAELLKARGMNVGPVEIRELAGAVVKLRARGGRGGATGSFVSSEGLILTNHHVAYRCIVDNSVPGADLLEDGFLAKDRADERPCPRVEALVPRDMRDLRAELDAADDAEAAEAELLDACNKKPNTACEIAREVPSGRVVLVEYGLVRDVRLVHAPEESFASFGGAVDNFEWPRHSADYTLLRAYAGPGGDAREHDPTNVPYKPLQLLHPARIGVGMGDVVFSLGYPYETSRFLSEPELRTLAEVLVPERISLDEALASLARAHLGAGEGASIAIASLRARYENRLKLHRALAAGIERNGALAAREAESAEIAAWASADEAMGAETLSALRKLQALEASADESRRDELLARSELFQSLTWALLIAERAHELTKPENERGERFRAQALAALDARIGAASTRSLAAFEAEALAIFIERALALPEPVRLEAVESRVERPLESPRDVALRLASRLVGSSALLSAEGREAALKLDAGAFATSEDGLLAFARDLDAERRTLRDARAESAASRDEARKAWHAAFSKASPLPLAPDANGTQRFTHGVVRGYAPPGRGSRFGYATTAGSMMATNAGAAPHELPPRVVAQLSGRKLPFFVDSRLGDLPVNFVATLDGIGGSSGSPVLDARGQLVGLVFDLNHEAAANDIDFDERYGRAIAVDIRFVLDAMLRIYGAVELVQEMGVGQ